MSVFHSGFVLGEGVWEGLRVSSDIRVPSAASDRLFEGEGNHARRRATPSAGAEAVGYWGSGTSARTRIQDLELPTD
jgi:hypothetical protein